MMQSALVVTTIHPPNVALRSLAAGCRIHGWDFIVAGDSKSPADFQLDSCHFLSLADQQRGGTRLGRLAPVGSYTRKNIGYLAAIANGAEVVVETDDDNHPREDFWQPRVPTHPCRTVTAEGWVNAYRYFSDRFIYPRGLPLESSRAHLPSPGGQTGTNCPIQQGLADRDPDVDAVYRMLFTLPFDFDAGHSPIALISDAWCPFNSQNTTFFREVFPLLYLPAHCSFRMTDIWRSFVALRVLHLRGQALMFHGATVWQERNDHDLTRDFIDELPGYLHNAAIRKALMAAPVGQESGIRRQMEHCYQVMIRNGWISAEEETLLSAWFDDLEDAGWSEFTTG